MRIAIQAADLDYHRIDGTRVYILNLLKFFGALAPKDEFLIYHRSDFNPALRPPVFPNYQIKKAKFPFLWTQTRFALEVFNDNPDVLWMPMHNFPLLRRKKMKTVVTIHDLAFKFFPSYFPRKDLRKINYLTDWAVKRADKIIAVSQSTKNDILKVYPEISEEKIKIIYHGFDEKLFQKETKKEKSDYFFSKFNLLVGGQNSKFILYVGAIQPRKNLKTLIQAFEIYKRKNTFSSDLKLVLAGEKAWLWEETLDLLEKSPFRADIVFWERPDFEEVAFLYRYARVFVFPSLYEGFGIPILEAFAAETPVIAADNSSLREAGGEAAKYFLASDARDLAEKIEKVLENENIRATMIAKGKEQARRFSWEKCARETLEYLKS